MQNVHFSTTELATLFDVNVSTIKRWIDRKLLRAEITPGGHRRVTRENLEQFLENYKKIAKQSYVIGRLNNKRLRPEQEWKRMYSALLRNDIAACRTLFREYYVSKKRISILLENIITPVLRHIGNEWSEKNISIYEEHQMSFLIRMLLVEISNFLPEPLKNAPRAVLACVEGERHEIPLQMLALVLQAHGIQAVILGTNISVAEIIRATEETHAQFLLLTRVYSELRSFNYLRMLARYAEMHKRVMVYGGEGWNEKEKNYFKNPQIFYAPSLMTLEAILVK